MKRLQEFWREDSGAMADRLPFLVAGALLILLLTGAIDESIRNNGLAWAEQMVHEMGF